MAADENNVPFLSSALTFDAILTAIPFILLLFAGLAKVLEVMTGSGPIDPQSLFERFLPPHDRTAGSDPFSAVEVILGQITSAGKSLGLDGLLTRSATGPFVGSGLVARLYRALA